ncbi:MAG: hypothetical protein ACOX3Q_03810 [Clostridia bacterium]|jgi:hypothetical protein|nr:hypothetical protein [Clostridiaceae bacterium]
MLVFITLLHILVVFHDFVPIAKEKNVKLMVIFLSLTVLSYVLFFLSIKQVLQPKLCLWFMDMIDAAFGERVRSDFR